MYTKNGAEAQRLPRGVRIGRRPPVSRWSLILIVASLVLAFAFRHELPSLVRYQKIRSM